MATLLDAPVRFAFRTLNAIVDPLVRDGRLAPLPVGGGLVVLETTGRRTGRLRKVPLAATRIGDTVVVSTIRPDSQWLRNLEACPEAGVWIRGHRRPARAEVRRGPLNVVQLALGDVGVDHRARRRHPEAA